ncbi:MAG: RNA pseudouridine synthase [Treponema sp.]|jgi:23S rRNA pseudouridine1911/1915/1917 synthase|nr:RNA pseudouridine synthase [Treponema sp.]
MYGVWLRQAQKSVKELAEEVSVNPYVVDETPAYAVVYKPPRMHSVPLKSDAGRRNKTLLDWCAGLFPEVLTVQGKNPWEGGLLHRLDYETRGLVLAAKTQTAMDVLGFQQEAGLFIKAYSALSVPQKTLPVPGFPPRPRIPGLPFGIESAFRAFGPGQRAVRPVALSCLRVSDSSIKKRSRRPALDRDQAYRTEILEKQGLGTYTCFHLQIKRGFRHQIRCHLAWLGFPLLNDALYGGVSEDGVPPREAGFAPLALIGRSVSFYDPVSKRPRQYVVPGFPDLFL